MLHKSKYSARSNFFSFDEVKIFSTKTTCQKLFVYAKTVIEEWRLY
jgi:hypothetical protein